FNGYNSGIGAAPSNAALATMFPNRPLNGAGGAPSVYPYPQNGVIQSMYFNPGGSLWIQNGPLSTSGYSGPTNGASGYGIQTSLATTMPNGAAGVPNEIQTLKWNNPLGYVSSPQTRYSFFANGTYDLTDKIQFYTNARYAESRTQTLLPTPTTSIFGWEADVP